MLAGGGEEGTNFTKEGRGRKTEKGKFTFLFYLCRGKRSLYRQKSGL
jgi:hypothetical protein